MPKPPPTKHTPVIAVINMKGGVGKTTLSGNIFREVFRRKKKKTLLIDFDPQFNLSQLLLTRNTYETLRDSGRSLWHALEPQPTENIFNTSTNDLHSIKDIKKYITRLKYFSNAPELELNLLPGDFRVAQLNLRENPDALRTPRKRFSSLLEKARQSYDLVVLDCNPSSSFLTRCAIESATHLLIPVKPDKYSILGVKMIQEYVAELPTISHAPDFLIIFNDLPNSTTTTAEESELRSHPTFGPQALVNKIPHSGVLNARSDYTGFAVDRKVKNRYKIGNLLAEAADEIAAKVGIK